MMCALGPRDEITVAVVADPEDKAIAWSPPASMDARVSSRAFLLGFPLREYSKPCGRLGRGIRGGMRRTYLVVADPVLLVGRRERYGRDDRTRLCVRLRAYMDRARPKAQLGVGVLVDDMGAVRVRAICASAVRVKGAVCDGGHGVRWVDGGSKKQGMQASFIQRA